MRRQEERIEMPTAEELPMIMQMVYDEFSAVGVNIREVETPSAGGLKAKATVTATDREKLVCALFAHGIVMVDLGPEEFGFAVRR